MLLVINEYVNESKVLPLFTKSILPTSYVSQNSNLCPTAQLNSFFIRCHNHVVVHHYLQHSKSLTFYFVMHHPVFGINFRIHHVSTILITLCLFRMHRLLLVFHVTYDSQD